MVPGITYEFLVSLIIDNQRKVIYESEAVKEFKQNM